jgi:hypothetical protein
VGIASDLCQQLVKITALVNDSELTFRTCGSALCSALPQKVGRANFLKQKEAVIITLGRYFLKASGLSLSKYISTKTYWYSDEYRKSECCDAYCLILVDEESWQ